MTEDGISYKTSFERAVDQLATAQAASKAMTVERDEALIEIGRLKYVQELYNRQRQKVKKVIAERDALQRHIDNLQSTERILTCVYCGKEYPPGTASSGVSALTKHIQQCPKHPLKAMTEERDNLSQHLETALKAVKHLAEKGGA